MRLAAAIAVFAALLSVSGGTSAMSSLSSSGVTVYGASWCSACRSLEKGLTDRKIPFEVIDVDRNQSAFEKAKAASGAGNAIPLTGIARSSGTTAWVVGADIDAVERAFKE